MLKLLWLTMLFPSFALADIYKCKTSSGSYLSSESCPSGAVIYESEKPVQSQNSRTIGLRRGVNGVFNIRGEISGVPVGVIIDTGAGRSTVSGRVAYALGIRNCVKAGVSETANGKIDLCKIRVAKLAFGGFEFNDVPMMVAPNMVGDVLIGNDYLYAFKVEVSNDVMYLSR